MHSSIRRTLFFLVLAPELLLATGQVGEVLVLEGKSVEMFTTPLESLFSEDRPRPKFEFASTACWRGYIGVWEIEDGLLYLQSLHKFLPKAKIGEGIGKAHIGEEIPLGFTAK